MSESGVRTVAGAILDLLAAHGVTTCFGLPGVHNLPFWDALTPERPRIVGVRHEQAAGYAGDATWRTGHGLGVALVTSGPGAGNVVAAFGEAAAAGSGLLLIASESPLVSRGHERQGRIRHGLLHETTDQADLFGSLGSAVSVQDPVSALDAVLEGIERATWSWDATGPTYVGVPADVLAMPYDDDLPEMVYGTPRPVDADLIARASAVLAGAERPIVWAGGGVAATESQAAVGELVDAIGAIVVTTYAGRGVLADHPGTLRVPAHEPLAQQLFSDADALVVIGSGFDAMNTRGWGLRIPERVVVIDASPASGAAANLPTVSVVIEHSPIAAAELAAHLVAAQALYAADGIGHWQARAAEVSEQVRAELRENPKTTSAEAFLTAIETGWPSDGSLVVDMCVPGYWVGGYARAPRPRRMAYPVGWGTLGFGLPAAIGPAAHGNPTLAVCGDGGAAFALGELGTFVQERLPITLLIVDDGGYGMLRFDQQVFGHEIRGVDLMAPDWAQLAKAYSIAHVEVPDGPGLSAALRVAYQANLRGEPRMIVLHDRFYPPRTTSPRWSE